MYLISLPIKEMSLIDLYLNEQKLEQKRLETTFTFGCDLCHILEGLCNIDDLLLLQ